MMTRHVRLIGSTLVLLALLAVPSSAGVVDFAIGAYGGLNYPMESYGVPGSVIGAKVRVTPPIPLVGFEAWYSRFGYEYPDDVYALGDVSLFIEDDGFDMWGADALIGNVKGVLGFAWYGIVGVNSTEFRKFGTNDSERKLGGELGVGVEVRPPTLPLGFEGRGTVMFPDLSGDFSEQLLNVTVGVNYHF